MHQHPCQLPAAGTRCEAQAPIPGSPTGRGTLGFTLVEMLVTVAIIAILASIALPSYQSSIRKSRRADALGALQQIQIEQEKLRANCSTYASTLTGTRACGVLGYPKSTSPDNYYDLTIETGSATATGFTAIATAASSGAQFSDTDCRQIILTVSNLSLTKTSKNAAGTATTSCWTQ